MKNIILKTAVVTLGLAGIYSCSPPGVSTKSTAPNLLDYNEGYVQIERLARPAINEGLVITNDYLNAFNSISSKASENSLSAR